MCPPSSLSHPTGATTTPTPYNHHSAHIPQTPIARSAHEHASSLLAPSILNHSMRVYLYASTLATHTQSAYTSTNTASHDLLFTACLLHDIGTVAAYDGPQRFEVEGADAAVQFLSQFPSVSDAERHEVWTAIACHTSPQIAERIGELARLVRVAVVTDFGRKSVEWAVLEPRREELEGEFERGGIEKVLGDAVVEQAVRRPEKAPMVSWPGVMYKAHLAEPEWGGVNRMF